METNVFTQTEQRSSCSGSAGDELQVVLQCYKRSALLIITGVFVQAAEQTPFTLHLLLVLQFFFLLNSVSDTESVRRL